MDLDALEQSLRETRRIVLAECRHAEIPLRTIDSCLALVRGEKMFRAAFAEAEEKRDISEASWQFEEIERAEEIESAL